MITENGPRPVMEYPCRWIYKVIGPDEKAMEEAIGKIVRECACTITPSNTSRTGKYHCLNLEVMVVDERHRTGVYNQLREDPAIKIVL